MLMCILGAIYRKSIWNTKKKWQHLNRQHQHLRSGCSCVSSILCVYNATGQARFPGTADRPAGCCLSLGQNKHYPELKWPGRIPVACTQPGHRKGPRDHHTQSPTVLHNKAQHDLRICAFHSAVGHQFLWERGNWAQSQTNKMEVTLRSSILLPQATIIPKRCFSTLVLNACEDRDDTGRDPTFFLPLCQISKSAAHIPVIFHARFRQKI